MDIYYWEKGKSIQRFNTKKLLGAWIHCPRKAGYPQNSSKKHFLMTLKTVLPDLSKADRFQEWFGLATDKRTWGQLFDMYQLKVKLLNCQLDQKR